LNSYSKILILMSDNRDLSDNIDESDYNSLSTYINYRYAKIHGYDFKYLQPRLNNKVEIFNCYSPSNKIRHASWSKILSVTKIMKEYPTYDWILYLDSDCIFNDNTKTIYQYLLNSKNIKGENLDFNQNLFFMNNQPWNPDLPCAGFFIIKNSSEMLWFIESWYSDESVEEFNTWHPWEQNALHLNLNLDCEIINDWMFRERPSQFLRHIGTEENHNRIPYFKSIINKIDINDEYSRVMKHLSREIITYDTLKK